MKSFYFVFGRTPELSFAELSSLVSSAQQPISLIGKVPLTDEKAALSLFAMLGGSIKVAVYLQTIDKTDDQGLLSLVGDHKLVSLTVVGQPPSTSHSVLAAIKSQLKEKGKHFRYITASDSWGVSAASFTQDLHELILVPTLDGYEVAKTIQVQDIYSWSHRDYDRPYADAKLGMLPPKVARMAVNIALGAIPVPKPIVLADPFCGMGTILSEALLLGCTVIGSDIQEQIIIKAKSNIEWLKKQYQIHTAAHLFQQDATHLSHKLGQHAVDVIVTEPFMGTTQLGEGKLTASEIANVMKGLEKLYIGCLREWFSVLRPHGLVMMALPSVSFKGREYFVKRVIDTCENLGYTTKLGPIVYSRPQAIVKRNFYLFQKVMKEK